MKYDRYIIEIKWKYNCISALFQFVSINILCIILLTGCSGNKNENTVLKGKLFNPGTISKIYLDRLDISTMYPFDSSGVESATGDFEFFKPVSETGFYRLRVSNNNFLTLIISPGDKINLEASADNIGITYSVTGSASSGFLRQLHQFIMKTNGSVDSLKRLFNQYQQSQASQEMFKELDSRYRETVERQKEFIRNFLNNHPDDFSAVAAISYIDPRQESELYSKTANNLHTKYPNSVFVKAIYDRSVQLSRFAPGTNAPEIILNNPEGKPVALSSLRGKIVLIDFWASWCRPCRMENPNVVRIYKKFSDKGFEIFGVSLDKSKEAWVSAIRQDGLPWTHVSDLGYWNSAVVKIYDIQAIPATVLIDKEGKIIARDLKGAFLEQKLEEIFGNGT